MDIEELKDVAIIHHEDLLEKIDAACEDYQYTIDEMSEKVSDFIEFVKLVDLTGDTNNVYKLIKTLTRCSQWDELPTDMGELEEF